MSGRCALLGYYAGTGLMARYEGEDMVRGVYMLGCINISASIGPALNL